MEDRWSCRPAPSVATNSTPLVRLGNALVTFSASLHASQYTQFHSTYKSFVCLFPQISCPFCPKTTECLGLFFCVEISTTVCLTSLFPQWCVWVSCRYTYYLYHIVISDNYNCLCLQHTQSCKSLAIESSLSIAVPCPFVVVVVVALFVDKNRSID